MCITRQLLSLGKKSENEQDKNKLNLGHTYWSNIPEKKKQNIEQTSNLISPIELFYERK